MIFLITKCFVDKEPSCEVVNATQVKYVSMTHSHDASKRLLLEINVNGENLMVCDSVEAEGISAYGIVVHKYQRKDIEYIKVIMIRDMD
jgi:hypothetical protein